MCKIECCQIHLYDHFEICHECEEVLAHSQENWNEHKLHNMDSLPVSLYAHNMSYEQARDLLVGLNW
jgi:hypothetical protein